MLPTQGPVTPVTRNAFSVTFNSATALVARRKAACQSPAPVALAVFVRQWMDAALMVEVVPTRGIDMLIDILALDQLSPEGDSRENR